MRISYEHDADILNVWLSDGPVIRSEEHDWGLLDVGSDGEVVGIECWRAGKLLPQELLAALPSAPLASRE